MTDRLQKLQMPCPQPLEDVTKYSIHELENMKMDFGSTHRGKSYATMWSDHQDWIKWFIDHYQSSTNVKHRRILHYIELKIERHELEGTPIPVPTVEGVEKRTNPVPPLPAPKKMSAAKTAAKSMALPTVSKSELLEEMGLEESYGRKWMWPS